MDFKIQKAVLVAVIGELDEEQTERSLDELERLLETAGGLAAARITQARGTPDKATYIGSGKAKEIAEFVKTDEEIDLVVFDNELSPSQIFKLEEAIGLRVIDRTMLILDIFALHATTGEGKLQVEMACLRYSTPRLTGKGKQLSRQGGGMGAKGTAIGTRGPGETKLESDRRYIKKRINALAAELADMDKNRSVQRAAREKSGIAQAAVIGYTNAGKSTLLNYLTDAGILAEDKLFATLDPTTRRLKLPNGTDILLTDTVGFIDRLPTHLIKAFKSTLDELKYADMIINLTDSSENAEERLRKREVTLKLINELGAGEKPVIEVMNKCDISGDEDFNPREAIKISAKTGEGVGALLQELEKKLSEGKRILELFIPREKQNMVTEVYRLARVIGVEYEDDGTRLTAECDRRAQGAFSGFKK